MDLHIAECVVSVFGALILAFTAGSEGPLGPGESGSESPQPAASAAGFEVYFIVFYVLCFGGLISLKLPFVAMLVLCIVSILFRSACLPRSVI